ncbi:hypothetical protein [Amycolatopsis albispora]|uniref:PPE family domain-containing protein n=1 Tax=Amycolatopsis albispora TaxID=1804986 RepID=A0A344LEV1_9PSEU|nr:hypothetical protein [Amycolatopsis albispora]AXB46575.1 hypothetical protein A4R43_32410 [Amycolatopsis albispora]
MVEEGSLTASQIYEQINGGLGTGYLEAAQNAVNVLRTNLMLSAQMVGELAAQIQDGWTGEAGNTAANAAAPLAKASIQDADLLSDADQAVANQGSAFGTVKNSVVPVPPNKPELTSADVVEAITTGNWNTYNHKLGEWQAKTQQNIDAFAGYHATSMDNGDTMPNSFTPLVDPGAPISLAEAGGAKGAPPAGSQPGGPTGGVGGGLPNSSQPDNGQPDASHSSTNQPGTNHPGTNHPRPGKPGTNQPVTHPIGNHPSPEPPPKTGFPQEKLPGQQTPLPQDGTKAAAYQPAALPEGPKSPPVTPPHTPSATPTGGPGQPPTPPAPGRFVGGTPGEPAAAAVPRSGATTGTKPATSIPMTGLPPGGNRGEDNKERERPPYLTGPDPEELFGGDTEKPVPPVIGESKQQPE